MTLIEMLDTLDAEISRLRAERAKLAAALDAAQQQLRALLVEPSAAKSSRKPPKTPDTGPPKPRPAPKRQALGKTLAQLRTAARREIV